MQKQAVARVWLNTGVKLLQIMWHIPMKYRNLEYNIKSELDVLTFYTGQASVRIQRFPLLFQSQFPDHRRLWKHCAKRTCRKLQVLCATLKGFTAQISFLCDLQKEENCFALETKKCRPLAPPSLEVKHCITPSLIIPYKVFLLLYFYRSRKM